MSKRPRVFRRPPPSRTYLRIFVLSVEGRKTEPNYFELFNGKDAVIRLRGDSDSSPPQVLKRMERFLAEEELKPSDEAWLVTDKDQWTDDQLNQLHQWSKKKANYGFALSNPKFEYWLLLHFEDGANLKSARDCGERLKRHLPNYDKGIEQRTITEGQIRDAIRRARVRDEPPCADWPRDLGSTTVYRLVESILTPRSQPNKR